MKYTLINEHFNVDFHDVYVNSVYFQESHMIWELAALQTHNIIKDIGSDNCYIKNAVMILENAHIENIVIDGYELYENGVLVDSKESTSASPNEYQRILKNISYRNFSYIYGIEDLTPANQGEYKMGIMVHYEMIVAFTKSIIMWDEFGGTEWRRNKLWSNEHPNE